MQYIKGSTIPLYILDRLKKDGTTVIGRSRIKKYGEDELKKIFAAQGIKIEIEILDPIGFKSNLNRKYPKDATYLLHRI